MATTIYYFSGTGNSLYLTRQLATKIGNCQIKSMANPPPIQPVGGPEENMGFVFPVYYRGLPRIVKQFAEKLNIRPGTYCFAVANYGGSKQGTLAVLNETLNSKGTQLSYTEGIKLPGNYILKFDVPSTDETHKILEEADGIIEAAANAIAKKEIRPLTKSGMRISKIGSRIFYRSAAKFDEKFTVNAKCTSCGLCSEICPVQNIKLVNKKPAWQHHCERCLACIQWCPAEAIQYGKKTAKRGRYHNPHIIAKDIVEGNKGTTNV